MSIRVFEIVKQNYPTDASSAERLVIWALADHAHDDGAGIYPSLSRVAGEVSMSVRTVRRLLRKIEMRGWLECVAYQNGGRKRTREYKIPSAKLNPDNQGPKDGQPGSIKADIAVSAESSKNLHGIKREKRGRFLDSRVGKENPPSKEFTPGEEGTNPSDLAKLTSAQSEASFQAFFKGFNVPRRGSETSARSEWCKLHPNGVLANHICAHGTAWAEWYSFQERDGEEPKFISSPANHAASEYLKRGLFNDPFPKYTAYQEFLRTCLQKQPKQSIDVDSAFAETALEFATGGVSATCIENKIYMSPEGEFCLAPVEATPEHFVPDPYADY